MTNKNAGVFKRKKYPTAKNSKLPDYLNPEQLKILRTCMERGSAIIFLGTENSPKDVLLKLVGYEMVKPTNNGIMVYDANVPYTSQSERDIITLSVNDWGNKNYVHSIKRIGPIRSRTLYAWVPEATKLGGDISG